MAEHLACSINAGALCFAAGAAAVSGDAPELQVPVAAGEAAVGVAQPRLVHHKVLAALQSRRKALPRRLPGQAALSALVLES